MWELSVEKNSQSKAEDDYAKRLVAPDGNATSSVTYVALICRPWTKAGDFARAHNAEQRWKKVRAYNVDDIETWLESAPMTTVWLAEKIGRPIDGIRSADDWWADWLASTTVALHEGIVLAGRRAEAEALIARVCEPGTTVIGGDLRIEELRGFVAAVFARGAPDGALRPVLFLSDTDDARKLLGRPGKMTFVAPSMEFIRDLPISDHHIIVLSSGAGTADITVPPVASSGVAASLAAVGVADRVAHDYGALGRRSLLALRRRLAVKPALHEPAWASPGADIVRRRILLAGSWNQSVSGDREALEALIGRPYAEIEDYTRAAMAHPDVPMVSLASDLWHVVSLVDTWMLLGSQLSSTDIEAFRQHAKNVLLEPDPFAGLSESERLSAQLHGIRPLYSTHLAGGVAKTLALLGTVGDVVEVGARQTGTSIASSIVSELLHTANNDLTGAIWSLLAPQLHLLSEAAPNEVLKALRTGVADGGPLVPPILAEGEQGPPLSLPLSVHTRVQWALDNLVWSPTYFDATVSVYARLAELDPGGTWGARPARGLAQVFFPWHPNTCASTEQRLATLQRLRISHPNIAWSVLLSLLPGKQQSPMVHQGPTYREWKTFDPVVSRAEFAQTALQTSRWILEGANVDCRRWEEVIKDLSHLHPDVQSEAVASLTHHSENSSFSEPERELIWNELRKLTARHREFREADWALPVEQVEQLERLRDLFAPSDPVRRYLWLFAPRVTLGDIRRSDGFETYQDGVAQRRAQAVEEINKAHGLAGVVRLAAEAESAGQVGASLGVIEDDGLDDEVIGLVDSSDNGKPSLAFGYFARRFEHHGWKWLDGLIDKNRTLSPAAIASLLRTSWDAAVAARRADELGEDIARAYWLQFPTYCLGHEFDDAVLVSARLLAVGRIAAALDLLSSYSEQSGDAGYAEAILTAFEAAIEGPDDPELHHLDPYQTEILVKHLARERHALGVNRVARIEWYFLSLLGFNPDAPTLHAMLSEDPAFFVEILSKVYRSNDASEHEPATDLEAHEAENADRLLHAWKICPGVNSDGTIDPERLRSWVNDARAILAEVGRAKIGDEKIGEALAAAPSDLDGTWPCQAVRDLLEELQNDDVDCGLQIKIFNNRGVTSRSLDEGGMQDIELSKNHRASQHRFLARWPRTGTIMRQLADTYESYARSEETEAERRRRGLDH